MLDTPRIVEVAARRTAVIPIVVSRSEIRSVMGPGIAEVRAVVEAQGFAPSGPWFTHHLRMSPEVFDFEVGVPVEADIAAEGRVKPGQLPASTVAQAVYQGGYEGLGAAWGEFDAWIVANGHTPAADLWECYAIGPESSPDPLDWPTELNRPVIGPS